MISKSERTELRAVVKQQFKVLRSEIQQREAELRTDAEDELTKQHGAEDKTWAEIEFIANEAIKEANRKINDALREHDMGYQEATHEYSLVTLHYGFGSLRKKTNKGAQKERINLEIKERVKRAELALDRQEADLLRSLAIGAIESDEARDFLRNIPSVGELVPSVRLPELVMPEAGQAQ